MPSLISTGDVAADVLSWRSAAGEQVTVIVKATFELPRDGLARVVEPEPLEEGDRAPAKMGADVIVRGPVASGARRRLVGVAVARGTEILFGRRVVRSFVEGEATWTSLDGEPAEQGLDAVATPRVDGELVEEDGDVSRFNVAPRSQRMEVLRGGEQLLVVGLEGGDVLCRLPAVTAHAAVVSSGGSTVPLVGDTLVIDTARRLVTVTWRGHAPAAASRGEIAVSLVPLVAVEEVLGAPPSWTRSARRPAPERPPIMGDDLLPAVTMPGAPDRLAVVVKGTFELVDGAPARRLDEQPPLCGDVFFDDEPGGSLRYPSDVAPPKDAVDVVATGFVYRRDGASVATARLSVGEVDRRVVAMGPRRWDRGVLTAPEPFERVAMRHEHAVGGAEVDANPVGTGADGTPPPGLEDPDRLMRAPSDRPAPACLAPVSPSWKARQGGGTYDQRWMDRQWPDVPTDFDRRAFQVAPPDQRCASLRGDEAYVLSSMRPGGEDWRGSLPGVRPLCFAWRQGESEPVGLKLDTVVFDAEAGRVTLVWRGAFAAAGVERLWLTVGGIDAAPSLPRAWGVLAVGRDARFSAPAPEVEPTLGAVRRQLAIVERRQQGLVRGGGGPAAAPSPPSPPSRDEVRGWAASNDLAGRDLTGADLRDLDLTGKSLAGCTLAGACLNGSKLDGVDLKGAVLSKVSAVDSKWDHAVLSTVDAAEADLRGASLAGAKLDGANLSGAKLDGADLRKVDLAGADLTRASLCDARLDDAALDRADLSRATLDRATFRRATVTEAKLYEVLGEGVVFDEAMLDGARLEGASLPKLSAREMQATGSMWERAALTGAEMPLAVLAEASFNGALLEGANLARADVQCARLRAAKLAGAKLLAANLMHADMEGADLSGADLRGANLYGAEMRDAVTSGCKLELANVVGTKLMAPRAR